MYIDLRYGFVKRHKISNHIEYFDKIFRKDSIQIVEKNAVHIMGLAGRLRSEIDKNKPIKKDFSLGYDDFNKMTTIAKVFGIAQI